MGWKKEQTITIGSGGTKSGLADIGDCKHVGFEIPAIDTAVCYLIVSSNGGTTTRRVQKEDGSDDLTLASGAGGKYWQIQMPISHPFVGIETSAAQSSGAVTIKVFSK